MPAFSKAASVVSGSIWVFLTVLWSAVRCDGNDSNRFREFCDSIAAITLRPEFDEARKGTMTISNFCNLQTSTGSSLPIVQTHMGVLVTKGGEFYYWDLEDEKLSVFTVSHGGSVSNFTFTVAAALEMSPPVRQPMSSAAVRNAVVAICHFVAKRSSQFTVRVDPSILRKAVEDSRYRGTFTNAPIELFPTRIRGVKGLTAEGYFCDQSNRVFHWRAAGDELRIRHESFDYVFALSETNFLRTAVAKRQKTLQPVKREPAHAPSPYE